MYTHCQVTAYTINLSSLKAIHTCNILANFKDIYFVNLFCVIQQVDIDSKESSNTFKSCQTYIYVLKVMTVAHVCIA